MKHTITLLIFFCTLTLQAQTVAHNHQVTFRYDAPDATEVVLELNGMRIPMLPGNGTWNVTTDSLPSDLYTYRYIVDGKPVTEAQSLRKMRDIDNWFDYFIIPDGIGSYFEANNVPHGKTEQTWYTTADGNNRRMSVYLPPSYGNNNQPFPVLYLLHGSGGDELAWLELGRAAQILDNLIAEGKAEEMIVVMPSGNMWQEASPAYYPKPVKLSHRDVRLSGAFEMQFPEIIHYIDTHYNTVPDKHHRAVAGLSMGGYHAMHISHHYPHTFDYVGLFSPAYCPTKIYHDNILFPVSDSLPEVYRQVENELQTQFQAGLRLYWIAIGTDDFLYEENRLFRQILDRNHYPYEYCESAGGHTWQNWRHYLLTFAQRLFR